MAKVQKKKGSFGTTMGVSSIIAILVILVLVVFSALSITTSKADLTLSQKTSNGVAAFYEADAAAEDMMAEVANAIKTNNLKGLPGDYEVSGTNNGTLISYTVSIDENRNLNVSLLADEGGNLSRELWQVVPAKEWVPDNNMNLFIPSTP